MSPLYFTERIWSGWRERLIGPNSQQQRVLASFTRFTLSHSQGTFHKQGNSSLSVCLCFTFLSVCFRFVCLRFLSVLDLFLLNFCLFQISFCLFALDWSLSNHFLSVSDLFFLLQISVQFRFLFVSDFYLFALDFCLLISLSSVLDLFLLVFDFCVLGFCLF